MDTQIEVYICVKKHVKCQIAQNLTYPNAKGRVLEVLMWKFEETSANYSFVFMKNEL